MSDSEYLRPKRILFFFICICPGIQQYFSVQPECFMYAANIYLHGPCEA